MSFVKQININSVVPSTCAVMDWLQDHGYPECDHTEIVLKNGGYGGLVSNYEPGQFEIESFKSDLPLAKKYHGMYRFCECAWAWIFYMPEVNKYYCCTI